MPDAETDAALSRQLSDEERIAISAVVHQNYYMPDVFAAVESLLAKRLFLTWEAGFDGGVAASRGDRVENPLARAAPEKDTDREDEWPRYFAGHGWRNRDGGPYRGPSMPPRFPPPAGRGSPSPNRGGSDA